MANVPAGSVRLFEGYLYKRGKVNPSWKERWFVLSGEFKLKYYETKQKSKETFIVNNDRNVLGCIDLLQCERVTVSSICTVSFASIPKYIKYQRHSNLLSESKDERNFLISLNCRNQFSRTYKLSAGDANSFVAWAECLHRYLYEDVVCQSYLDKKGEFHTAFKTRFFTLNMYKHLKYYNNEERETLYGVVDLNVAANLTFQPSELHFRGNQFMQIELHKRTYTLCSRIASDLSKWRTQLSHLHDLPGAKRVSSPQALGVVLSLHCDTDEDEEEEEEYDKPLDIPTGLIRAQWFKAQLEILQDKQPHICTQHGVVLENLGQPTKHMPNVTDIQLLLDVRTTSGRGMLVGFASEDCIDFTDCDDSQSDDLDLLDHSSSDHNPQPPDAFEEKVEATID